MTKRYANKKKASIKELPSKERPRPKQVKGEIPGSEAGGAIKLPLDKILMIVRVVDPERQWVWHLHVVERNGKANLRCRRSELVNDDVSKAWTFGSSAMSIGEAISTATSLATSPNRPIFTPPDHLTPMETIRWLAEVWWAGEDQLGTQSVAA